ncbi:MAG TPA: protein-tyrosine phosphatase family protein [Mycobacteriales bacterium]|nr:protein-tyrosine phosphatase family protein [Mycobacteriales bacterium]
MDVRIALVCAESGTHWFEGEPARCTDPEHAHQRIEVHRHRTLVTLPDGTPITAASFDPADPYSRATPPDYGLYLDPRWAPPWPHDHVDWPDFGVPEDAAGVRAALQSVFDRARAGERVEIGCLGGHGRTGTALAGLAVLAGEPADQAVGWVRSSYCPAAIETSEQEAFAARFGR